MQSEDIDKLADAVCGNRSFILEKSVRMRRKEKNGIIEGN